MIPHRLEKVHKTPQRKTDRAVRFFADETSSLPCAKCALSLSFLLVAPCGCLYCPECAAKASPVRLCGLREDLCRGRRRRLGRPLGASCRQARRRHAPVPLLARHGRRPDHRLQSRAYVLEEAEDARRRSVRLAAARRRAPVARGRARTRHGGAGGGIPFQASGTASSSAPAWTPTVVEDAHTKARHVFDRLESAVAAGGTRLPCAPSCLLKIGRFWTGWATTWS